MGREIEAFTAAAAAAAEFEDINTYLVALAEETDGSGMSLECQLALTFDEQDRALGQDTYCLCTEDGACHYGGVTSWHLTDSVLHIALNAEASATFGVAGFRVEVPAQETDVIRAGLVRVLGAPTA